MYTHAMYTCVHIPAWAAVLQPPLVVVPMLFVVYRGSSSTWSHLPTPPLPILCRRSWWWWVGVLLLGVLLPWVVACARGLPMRDDGDDVGVWGAAWGAAAWGAAAWGAAAWGAAIVDVPVERGYAH